MLCVLMTIPNSQRVDRLQVTVAYSIGQNKASICPKIPDVGEMLRQAMCDVPGYNVGA